MAFFPTIKRLFASDNQKGDPGNQPSQGGGPGAARSELVVTATVLKPQTLNNMFRIRSIVADEK